MPQTIWKRFFPIGIGLILFILVFLFSHLDLTGPLRIADLKILNPHNGEVRNLGEIKGKFKVVTFFSNFHIDCMRQRVDMLNRLWRQFSKPGFREVEVIAIFGTDFQSRKICGLEFDCFLMADETKKKFLKMGIRNPYTVVIDRAGKVIFAERGGKERELEAYIHRVLNKGGHR